MRVNDNMNSIAGRHCLSQGKSASRHVNHHLTSVQSKALPFNRRHFGLHKIGEVRKRRLAPINVWPFDIAWGTSQDYATLLDTLPQNLFAASLFPYLGFLYHLTKSKQAPPLVLFGFYFLLVFVFLTIPAGIYAKIQYGTTLANVDWLHGGAESMLTLTNLFIVIGLRRAIRDEKEKNRKAACITETAERTETVE